MKKRIEVGKRMWKDLESMPENVAFEFGQRDGFLLLSVASPTLMDVQAIRDERVTLGLFETDGILFFLARFGGMKWVQAPYHVDFGPLYGGMDIKPAGTYRINVILVNADNGIVEAVRLVLMPKEMAVEFKDILSTQRGKSTTNFDDRLEKIYDSYSVTEMVRDESTTLYKVFEGSGTNDI